MKLDSAPGLSSYIRPLMQ